MAKPLVSSPLAESKRPPYSSPATSPQERRLSPRPAVSPSYSEDYFGEGNLARRELRDSEIAALIREQTSHLPPEAPPKWVVGLKKRLRRHVAALRAWAGRLRAD